MHVLIADDEAPARALLRAMLEEIAPGLSVVGEAATGAEAVALAARLRPDAAFLDIHMPGGSGLDAAAQLDCPVVFVTAFDHYAIQAFETHAVDYILKPLGRERLRATVNRLMGGTARGNLRRSLKDLKVPLKLAAQRGRRLVLLDPDEVLYAGVEDRLVFLHTGAQRYLSSRTLTELEELLAPRAWFRVSRAALANLKHARELYPAVNGAMVLRVGERFELEVSRDRARVLKSRLTGP